MNFVPSRRSSQAQPSATLALTAKANALKWEGKPVVSLAAGEPDFKLPEPAAAALIQALAEGYTRYTPTSGDPDIKKAIAEKILRDQGTSIALDQIAVSCGAKHSLYNIFQVILNDGDEVIIPKPYWVSYPEMVKLAGGTPVFAENRPADFSLDVAAIERAVTPKTRAIVVNSPSNPTGAVCSEKTLNDLARLAVDKNLFVISDEIYEYFVFDGLKHHSMMNVMKNSRDLLIWVNGVSKSYGMTGLRIGYTIAHPAVIRQIGILQDHSTSNPVSLSQRAAAAALRMGGDYPLNLRTQFEARRNLIVEGLRAIKGLEVFSPGGAFYVFVSIAKLGMAPTAFAERLLAEKYVALIPGESFGAPQHIRLSFATSEDNIREGVSRIKQFVENHCGVCA